METQANHWLPLTEYALRSGVSISTLRRKIKSNTIEFKMEEGRYLIRGDDLLEEGRGSGFISSDTISPQASASSRSPSEMLAQGTPRPGRVMAGEAESVASASEVLREELRRAREDSQLRWKALDARVSGLAKKLDLFSEQMAEAKMLIKIFEEKLDRRA